MSGVPRQPRGHLAGVCAVWLESCVLTLSPASSGSHGPRAGRGRRLGQRPVGGSLGRTFLAALATGRLSPWKIRNHSQSRNEWLTPRAAAQGRFPLPAEHRHLPPACAPLCHRSTEMAQAAPAASPFRRRARVAKKRPPGPPQPSGHPVATQRIQASALRQPVLPAPAPAPAWDPAGRVSLPSAVTAASVIKGSDSAVYTASYIYLQEQDVEFSFNDEKSLSKDNSLELIMYIKATI